MAGGTHINSVSLPEKRNSQLDTSMQKGYPQVAVNTISSKVLYIDGCDNDIFKEYSNAAFQFDVSMEDINVTVDQVSDGKFNETQTEGCNRRKLSLTTRYGEIESKPDVTPVKDTQSVSLCGAGNEEVRTTSYLSPISANHQLDTAADHGISENVSIPESSNCQAGNGTASGNLVYTMDGHDSKANKSTRMSHISHQRRINETLGVIIVTFLMCWLPFCISWPIGAFCGCVDEQFYTFAYWAAYFNSFLNPSLYFLFNQDFKRALRKLVHCNTNREFHS